MDGAMYRCQLCGWEAKPGSVFECPNCDETVSPVMDETAIRADERNKMLALLDQQIKIIYAEDSTASDMMKEWAKGMVLAYNMIAKETWDKPSEMVEY